MSTTKVAELECDNCDQQIDEVGYFDLDCDNTHFCEDCYDYIREKGKHARHRLVKQHLHGPEAVKKIKVAHKARAKASGSAQNLTSTATSTAASAAAATVSTAPATLSAPTKAATERFEIPDSYRHLEKAQLYYGRANTHRTKELGPFTQRIRLLSDFKTSLYPTAVTAASRKLYIHSGALMGEVLRMEVDVASRGTKIGTSKDARHHGHLDQKVADVGVKREFCPPLAEGEVRAAWEALKQEKVGEKVLVAFQRLAESLKVQLE